MNQTKEERPKKIYLQIGEGQEEEDRTWCEDRINDSDIEYIRADLVKKEFEEGKK